MYVLRSDAGFPKSFQKNRASIFVLVGQDVSEKTFCLGKYYVRLHVWEQNSSAKDTQKVNG